MTGQNFYVLEILRTNNSWVENEICERIEDLTRKESDPLRPRLDRHHPPFCPQCQSALFSPYDLSPLRREMHIARPYFGDIIPCPFGRVYFSEYAKQLYEKSDISGVTIFREIEIIKLYAHNGIRKNKLPKMPKYYLADIIVDGAVMDYKKSNVVFCPPTTPICDFCKKRLKQEGSLLDRYRGIYIDITRWEGYDLFYLLGIGGVVIATQRFKDWYDRNQLRGCELQLSSQLHEDFGQYKEYVKEYGQEGLRYDLD